MIKLIIVGYILNLYIEVAYWVQTKKKPVALNSYKNT